MRIRKLPRNGLLIAILFAGLDQLSKTWITDIVMQPPRTVPLTPFCNLVLVHNRGISFGLFSTNENYAPYIFSSIAAIISISLVIWLWQAERNLVTIALGMILGGAVGNVIDRLSIGEVVDFLDFHAAGYHWPTFNVADIGITCGAALLIIDSFFHEENQG